MKREIKFRVFMKPEEWDGVGEMFYDVIPTSKDFKTWLIAFEGEANGYDGDFKVGENIEVMQYTGLKDKNGKEIYEGDIISFKFWNKPGIGKIEIRDGAFGYSYDCEVVDDIFRAFSDWDEPEIDCYPFIEVIGNIYETPHLLNKDQEVKECDATKDDSSKTA